MTSQPLAPIIVENQVINWRVFSGIAVGVHKYTKTHIIRSGGEYPTYSSRVEIIVECSIHKDDGEEIPVKLSTWEWNICQMNGKEGFEEIKLREGQLISVMGGYTDNRISNWLIIINHDDKKWYWLNSYSAYWWGSERAVFDIPQIGKFLDDLSIFKGSLLKKYLWRIEKFDQCSFFMQWLLGSFLVWSLAAFLYVFLSFRLFDPFNFNFLSIVCIGLGIGIVSLFKIWKEQINPSRQLVKLQIAEMAHSLL